VGKSLSANTSIRVNFFATFQLLGKSAQNLRFLISITSKHPAQDLGNPFSHKSQKLWKV
jgi:hypothetical protein